MAEPRAYQPHKLIVAAIYDTEWSLEAVADLVHAEYGPIDHTLPEQRFSFTRYYDAEMGSGLRRTIFAVRELVDPSTLAACKERSNRVESRHARGPSRRSVNLDPGLLSLSRVILATTKASAHRIPLRDGLYAEITLLYRRGTFVPLEWTYPDFRSERFVSWLAEVRHAYHEQLRRIDPARAWRL